MRSKLISNKAASLGFKATGGNLSLGAVANKLASSHHIFNTISKKLTSNEKRLLISFIEDVDSLLLKSPIHKIRGILERNYSIFKNQPEELLTIAKTIYLENTIMAFNYLSLLQLFRYDHEHLSLAYMFNKIDHTEVLTNKIIVNKDLHEVKEFDGIFITNKGATLIEVKHTLSKYAFRQILGYLIKKKNRHKHSHLDIILDKQLCKSNKIPTFDSIGIVFNRTDSHLAKTKFGASLKSLQNRNMLALQTEVFIEYLHEFISEKNTRIKIKKDLTKAGIKTIFFYRVSHPNIKTIFQQYNDILNKVLINHTELFIPPNNSK